MDMGRTFRLMGVRSRGRGIGRHVVVPARNAAARRDKSREAVQSRPISFILLRLILFRVSLE